MTLSLHEGDAELKDVVAEVSDITRQQVHAMIGQLSPFLVAAFYDHFSSHPQGKRFLADAETTNRLRGTLARWLADLFSASPQNPTHVIEAQRHIGRYHARAAIPLHLVSEGISLIQRKLIQQLGKEELPHDQLTDAVIYVANALSAAQGVISLSYWRHRERASSTDTAYRLFAMNQDLPREGEAQKATLMAWSYNVLRSIYVMKTPDDLAAMRLSRSAFGLWVTYKVGLLFEGTDIVAHLTNLIARVDEQLLPAISDDIQARRDTSASLAALHVGVTEIMNSLEVMFRNSRSSSDVEDPLTRAMNRRFLPSIMAYELRVASQTGRPLSVLFIDVDHFKRVNDTHGHAAGDSVLRAVAHTLEEAGRLSDMLFRYGGEEFLMILGDTDQPQMIQTAERLRRLIEETPVSLPDGSIAQVTVSIGGALYSGHPDYENLLKAADVALYQAKRNGRNRVEVAGVDHNATVLTP
ncbi:diguanylate cyclase [Gluconacetobacter johannae DSM 13595]|uniref:Diguanylate cyclase DosC n=1 Tax=Gluconacetobacter johannae TaxID=112140 RepID=A0A7W4P235_9PROT|nr:GGDEF domain-containing protein [Gluconacetobacter johannae]MBB2174389.1 GGDEF domain-containing protein [Gluconacetobacter johannae]GBQ85054.1 diguanylate cyclase [Gluconacetobacter johannae DSM 13595]